MLLCFIRVFKAVFIRVRDILIEALPVLENNEMVFIAYI